MRLATALALSAAVLLLGACAGDETTPVLPEGRAIETSRSLTPAAHLFAETVRAQLDVVVDRRLLDPARLRISTTFAPYERVAARRSRSDLGDYTRLRYEYDLRCLTVACIPVRIESILGEQESGRGERRTFRFPPALVRYSDPGQRQPEVLLDVRWPPLTSVSRLNEAQVTAAEFPFRISPTALPALSFPIHPSLLAGVLALAGVLLLALPARAVARWWRARRPIPEPALEPELSPLERALALVVWSCEHGTGDDRRKALANLASILAASGAQPVAEEAQGLAWSRPVPAPEAALALARGSEVDVGSR